VKETPFLAGREDCLPSLRRMSAFAQFDDQRLLAILAHSRIRRFDDGETIIAEGGDDRWMYSIISGAVRVEQDGRKIGTLAETGEVFGEMGVLDGAPRSATVRAQGETACLAVDSAFLDDLGGADRLACHSVFYRMFAQTLAERLRHTSEALAKAKKRLAMLRQDLGQEGETKEEETGACQPPPSHV
jgi:CRP/FNR family transcriptional regulator, cyclic AMP receptor protein